MDHHALAIIYLASALVMLLRAVHHVLQPQHRPSRIFELGIYILIFGTGALLAWLNMPLELPLFVKAFINDYLTPPVVAILMAASLAALITRAHWFLSTPWPRHSLRLGWLAFLICLADREFASLVLDADHIAVLIFLFGSLYFIMVGLTLAVENDLRKEAGDVVLEAQPHEKERIFVWPDLVYIEFLAMLVTLSGLLVWSLLVPAPLEPPADPSWTPNPSKAPWYFVGLQELLVYFDPWLAGVIIPLLIILGLSLIPYVDTQPTLSGYYGLKGRRFAAAVFLAGYTLWAFLILVGTFYRGPDWQFYGPFESRRARKSVLVESQPLSTLIRGENPCDRATVESARIWNIIRRESPGLLLLFGLFVGLPMLIRKTSLRRLFPPWKGAVFWGMSFLLGMMLLIPIKMFLNWVFNVNYIIYLPEAGLNI